MRLLDELRFLTRLYMGRHKLSQRAMGDQLDVSQPTVRTWCYSGPNETPTQLEENTLERLVLLLRKDGLMPERVAGRFERLQKQLRAEYQKTHGKKSLKCLESFD